MILGIRSRVDSIREAMKTDYFAHDRQYQNLKAEGKAGWTTLEEVDEFMVGVTNALYVNDIVPGGRVLELGCGSGEATLRLAAMGYEASGVDISPTAISWAKETAVARNIQADFRVVNVLDLSDWPGDYFDFVLDGRCFHCIIGEDRRLFLAEAHRVLKPGGVFHVRTMCGEVTDPAMKQQFDTTSRCLVICGIAGRYIGLPDEIIEEIGSCGFQIRRCVVQDRKSLNDQDDLLVDATKS